MGKPVAFAGGRTPLPGDTNPVPRCRARPRRRDSRKAPRPNGHPRPHLRACLGARTSKGMHVKYLRTAFTTAAITGGLIALPMALSTATANADVNWDAIAACES